MAEMKDIEELAKEYAASRGRLSAHVGRMEAEIKAVRARGMARLKSLSERAVVDRSVLEFAIESNPGLFERPRTRLLHGIKFGFAKAKGKLTFDLAPDVIVRLIRKHLPGAAGTLIKVTETPVKDAIAQLPAAALKKIGVSVEETGDRVVIKPVDSEIEKLVDALIALAEEPE